MQLLKAFDDFMIFKTSYCVPKSVQYYRENLHNFLSWMADFFHVDVALLDSKDLDVNVYRQYLIYLRSKSIKNTSVNTYIRAVKVFCRWLYEEGYIENDVTQRAKYPREDPDFIYPLQAEEVTRLDGCFNQNTFLGCRNYCIVHLMLDCGLRTGEVVALEWQHIKVGFIELFNCKFNKTRHVPLPDHLYQAIKRYQSLGAWPGDCDFVFLNHTWTASVTENTIKQLFADLKVKADIPRLHAHLLRHTFASSFVYYGGGLELLRILMGHSDYLTTQKYLHIASQMLICGYDMYKIDDMFFNLPGATGRNLLK